MDIVGHVKLDLAMSLILVISRVFIINMNIFVYFFLFLFFFFKVGVVIDWFISAPQISIPVAVAVGLILLGIIGACINSCVRRCRDRQPKNLPVVSGTLVQHQPPISPTPSSHTPTHSNRSNQDNWVDASIYNGPGL